MKFKSTTGAVLGACVLTLGVCSAAIANDYAGTPEALIKDGKFFGEVRYRFESVEQNNSLEDAKANTIRTNLGFKTGKYKGFSGLIEGQIVQSIGDDEFNARDGSGTEYSVVVDPDVAHINRAWVQYDAPAQSVIRVGRQFINLDNQRFVGTVGWRQNDQTFDAITLTNNAIEALKLQYSFVDNVNRIFAGPSPADDLESSVHLANASYTFSDALKATAYAYFMEFDNAPAASNRTYGLRATGKLPISENFKLSYEAEYAMQDDYGNNTTNYDLDYYHIAPKLHIGGFTLGAGYEVLEGDGTQGFQTPLATGHKFNGWADAFLNTPNDGLEDLYVHAGYNVKNTGTLADGLKLKAIYHDYEGEQGGDFGSEWNLMAGKSFSLPGEGHPFKKVNVLLKYADFDAEDAPSTDDTEKFWLQVGFKF